MNGPATEMYKVVTLEFRKEMIKQLTANWDKGDRDGAKGWLELPNKVLLNEVYYHVGKLQHALKVNDLELIKEFTADVANLCLMLHDKNIPLTAIPFAKSNEIIL